MPQPTRIAFLGGFLPRLCGIATFTHDLCEAVAEAAPASTCFTVAMNDRPSGYDYPPRVRFTLDQQDLGAYRRVADLLNFSEAQVLCLQHEYGIFGGPAGSHLMALLREVRMPVVTTLHTILEEPGAEQERVMKEILKRSDRVVVMARKGRDILLNRYGADGEKIDLIPHGIPDMPLSDSEVYKEALGVSGRPVLLTFGLLGPGKGIEYAIQALPGIVARHPHVVYLILGATHPHLVAREGEAYRLGLERLAEDLGVKDHVIFDNRFVGLEDLKAFIGATDIYLTPYLNEAQITSGTLAYVFGAGKAVVSTPYWHARELLSEDRGTLVPFRDPPAIARAVNDYLGDPGRLVATQAEAHRLGRSMVWGAVAESYLASFARAGADRRARPRAAFASWTLSSRPYELPPLRLDHIARMTDSTGILQHALFTVPNYREGYCTDDNARAFLLGTLLEELGRQPPTDDLGHLTTRTLAFLVAAFHGPTGRFRNFMGHNREWLEESGSEDSHARALWALGTGARRAMGEGHRKLSARTFQLGLEPVDGFSSPRAWAFTLLGLGEIIGSEGATPLCHEVAGRLTARLIELWRGTATHEWPWFEVTATYDNARLCQALLMAGRLGLHPEARDVGLQSLSWLASVQKTRRRHFRPIGNQGFYARGGTRADFDQQPVEAQAMVSACLEAHRTTGDALWQGEAHRAFEWFLGRNDLGLALYDSRSGGCSDGLHAGGISENQGAESTLAFHLSLAELNLAGHAVTLHEKAAAKDNSL